jgi:hypothetical protein
MPGTRPSAFAGVGDAEGFEVVAVEDGDEAGT